MKGHSMKKEKEDWIVEKFVNDVSLLLWQEKHLKARFNVTTEELRRCEGLARIKVWEGHKGILTNKHILTAICSLDLDDPVWVKIIKEDIAEEMY